MNKLRLSIAAWLLLALVYTAPRASAKDRITMTVGGSEESFRQRAYVIPGTNGHTTTNCDGTATATTVGATTTLNGNTNCNATVTPATAPMVGVVNIRQELVDAVMPNGTHIMLKCQQGWHRCAALEAGFYSAEASGDYISVFAEDVNGRLHKIKDRVVGGAAAYE